ncbi:MAG: hypothetical protein ACK6D2_14480 [Planctomycetota bacterium]
MTRGRAHLLALAATALVAAAPAQSPPPFAFEVAIAPAPQRTAAPAVAWLCETWLPRHPSWPKGRDGRDGLRLAVTTDGLTVRPLGAPLDASTVALGACTSGGSTARFALGVDGAEDWFVPTDFAPPTPWRDLLTQLDGIAVDRPRTLDTVVVVGHLAGGLADADPRSELLQLGGSLCGDVTWLAWRTPEWLRVRGRSGGGLAMPAGLMLLAAASGHATDGLALRAFASRDADRAEAARQMLRRDDDTVRAPLRAALRADDTTRLAAIDTLVRRRSTADLAAIIAAADDDAPWATLAATVAVRALWPHATPGERERARAPLARSPSPLLRAIDPATLAAERRGAAAGADPVAPPAARALIWLSRCAMLRTGLWARARAKLPTAPPQAS